MEQPAHWRGFDLGLEPADDVSSAEMAALGATLAPHTGTPGGCVFCFWVGSGVWVSDNGETDHGHLSDEGNEELNAPIRERWKRELEALENFSAGRASEPRALSLSPDRSAARRGLSGSGAGSSPRACGGRLTQMDPGPFE